MDSKPKGMFAALTEIGAIPPKVSEYDRRGKTLREIGVKLAKGKKPWAYKVSRDLLEDFVSNYKASLSLKPLSDPYAVQVGKGYVYEEHLSYVVECIEKILEGETSARNAFNMVKRGRNEIPPLDPKNVQVALRMHSVWGYKRGASNAAAQEVAVELGMSASSVWNKYRLVKSELEKSGSSLKQIALSLESGSQDALIKVLMKE